MAIYHLSVRGGTREKGVLAARKWDYVSRENRYEKRADRCFHKASGNLPNWAKDDRTYWEAADRFERANARLFLEVEFALPRGLGREAQIALAHQFTRDLTGDRFPYTLALHEGKGHNPHAHLILSERQHDGIGRSPAQWFSRANPREPERGGALKSRVFHSAQQIRVVRERWAERANAALERDGRKKRVSHLSLEAQGMSRIPTQHLGPKVLAMEERGIRTDRGQDLAVVYSRQERLTRELADVVERHLQSTREPELGRVWERNLGFG